MHLGQVLDQLDKLEQEIQELRAEIAAGFVAEDIEETKLFLRKCGGWQDHRSPDKIIAEIYTSRTSSLRSASLSHGRKTKGR